MILFRLLLALDRWQYPRVGWRVHRVTSRLVNIGCARLRAHDRSKEGK